MLEIRGFREQFAMIPAPRPVLVDVIVSEAAARRAHADQITDSRVVEVASSVEHMPDDRGEDVVHSSLTPPMHLRLEGPQPSYDAVQQDRDLVKPRLPIQPRLEYARLVFHNSLGRPG